MSLSPLIKNIRSRPMAEIHLLLVSRYFLDLYRKLVRGRKGMTRFFSIAHGGAQIVADRYKTCRICHGPNPNFERGMSRPVCDNPECMAAWAAIRSEREEKRAKLPREPLSEWPADMNFADNVRTVACGRLGFRPAVMHGGSSAARGIALMALLLLPHPAQAVDLPTSGTGTTTIQSAIIVPAPVLQCPPDKMRVWIETTDVTISPRCIDAQAMRKLLEESQ